MRKTSAQIADEVVATPTKEMLDHFNNRTNRHIELVRKYCTKLEERVPGLEGLHQRGLDHDQSKYEAKEKIPYVWLTWRYKCEDDKKPCVLPTGMKRMIDEATEHHILTNAHHPEFHQGKTSNLINKEDRDKPPKEMIDATRMSKLDLAEMVADWCAMSEERGNTPHEWAKKNVNVRWKYTPEQVKHINQFMDAAWHKPKTASEIGDAVLQKTATKDKEKSRHVYPGWLGSRAASTGTVAKKNALLRRLIAHSGYDPAKFRYHHEVGGSGPAYSPAFLDLFSSTDPESARFHPPGTLGNIWVDPGRHPIVLAHEAMHATPESTGEKLLFGARRFAGLPIPALLSGASLMLHEKMPRLSRGLGTGAIGLGAATLAAGLGEEMRATYKGRRALEDLGIKVPEREFKDARNLGLLTYVPLMGMSHLGIPAMARYALGRMR